MNQAWRYLAAGLAAFGVAGRPGHTVYFEMFGHQESTRNRARTDAEAIGSDWEAVGADLQGAMDTIDAEGALVEDEQTPTG